ncbi:MAG: sigma 54-interacting transcriptional regulator, partial [Planctomycetota bacterium]
LRVIEEGTFIPVGGTETRKVDVRIISATNKNLKELVNQGRFREDLYYRLNVIRITLPPLRERKEDIPLLIEHFLKTLPCATEKKIESIKPEAMKVIMDYHWPGNVRELQNVLERAIALTNSNYLAFDDLPEEIKQREKLPLSNRFDILKPFEEVKKEYIIRLLTETKGNITEAVRLSGLSSAGFYKLLKTYGISPHTFR